MTNPKPLVLPKSERHIIASCEDRLGYPVELGVTVSYTVQAPPSFDVTHGVYDVFNNDETDVFYTQDTQEALLVYNAIVQGDN